MSNIFMKIINGFGSVFIYHIFLSFLGYFM